MAKKQNNSPGVREEIRVFFLQGYSQKEIVDMDYAKSTVSEVKAEMEEKGELPLAFDNRKLVPMKEQPLEAIVENIEFPAMNCREFKKTARFVLSLSTIGIQQGKPVIEMAKEMRHSENQAAQALAEQIASNMALGNRELLSAIKQQSAGSTNPMEQLMADMMRQPLTQMISKVMGAPMGQTGAQPQSGPNVPGQGQVTNEEIKEVFND
jgi:S-ribosylhomocysteine lyase LuxS involved in autoinducer biosynthesis